MKKRILLILTALALVFSLLGGSVTAEAKKKKTKKNKAKTTQTTAAPTEARTTAASAEPGGGLGTVADLFSLFFGTSGEEGVVPSGEGETEPQLDEDGSYNSKDDVALYLHLYGHLPDNYITKRDAQDLGWSGGSLEPYAPGKSIGGSRFGNYEGILPEKKGRTYYECDIDTQGRKSRGAKRIVYSTDGLIYYTEDHYETFELLYGEE